MPTIPVTVDIACLAGKIGGSLASQGIHIAGPDLLIAATAVHSHYGILTLNDRHFRVIPGLDVITL